MNLKNRMLSTNNAIFIILCVLHSGRINMDVFDTYNLTRITKLFSQTSAVSSNLESLQSIQYLWVIRLLWKYIYKLQFFKNIYKYSVAQCSNY